MSSKFVDTPSDTLAADFLNLLSSVNLVRYVNFPIQIRATSLTFFYHIRCIFPISSKLSDSILNITDHYVITVDLEIKIFVWPLLPLTFFVWLHWSSGLHQRYSRPHLMLKPPCSLEHLLSCYKSTLIGTPAHHQAQLKLYQPLVHPTPTSL